MRLVDAAVHVLERHSEGRPMHYRRIAEIAASEGLITPQGLTPEASMNSSLNSDIARRREAGESERVVVYGRGFYGIVQRRLSDDIGANVLSHNDSVRGRLRDALATMDPGDFEDLIGRLLERIGFEDVEVTARSRDGGIDVRGTWQPARTIRPLALSFWGWSWALTAAAIGILGGALGALYPAVRASNLDAVSALAYE